MERAALKGTSAASRAAVRPRQALAGRQRLNVVAMAKKVTKKVEVVLSKDVANVGTVGEVKKVTLGHAKNFLIRKSTDDEREPPSKSFLAFPTSGGWQNGRGRKETDTFSRFPFPYFPFLQRTAWPSRSLSK